MRGLLAAHRAPRNSVDCRGLLALEGQDGLHTLNPPAFPVRQGLSQALGLDTPDDCEMALLPLAVGNLGHLRDLP